MKKTAMFFPVAVLVLTMSLATAGPAQAEGLSLRECVNRALMQNPLVAEGRLGVEAGSQGLLSARGKHLPRLSLEMNYVLRQDPVPFIPAQAILIPAHFSDEYAAWGVILTLPVYNVHRPHSALDDQTPSEFAENFDLSRAVEKAGF